MVPMSVLESVPYGGINLHPSLLPDWRGANPLVWQVAAGVERMGVSVHRLAAGADKGDLLAQTDVARPHSISREALLEHLEGEHGVPLLHKAIKLLQQDPTAGVTQPLESPTPYARALDDAGIARTFPLDTLDGQRVNDLVHLIGHCPVDWLKAAEGADVIPLIEQHTGRWRLRATPETVVSDSDVVAPWAVRQRGAQILLLSGDTCLCLTAGRS